MDNVNVRKKDEIVMKLVHYFITEENYTPIVVNGVKDEVWLENSDGLYRIIRINSNYIHNEEQYDFDIMKTRNVIKQIKRKTLSFSINALNIFLDVNDSVELFEEKNISALKLSSVKDVKKAGGLASLFPQINDKLLDDTKGLELIVNVTKDINKKTASENKKYENVFKPKPIIMTKAIMAICIIMFALMYILGNGSNDGTTLYAFGALNGPAIRNGSILDIFRIISSTFIHAGVLHIFFNMYFLNIVGTQVETYVGRWKFLLIYLISAISGSLMSLIFLNDPQSISVGASGAIFGLLGSLAYFGYHYRLYFNSVIKTQIIPILFMNLALGFMVPGIDNAAHVGGLIGGVLITMAVGISGKSKKSEIINGIIVTILYLAFLSYFAFVGI